MNNYSPLEKAQPVANRIMTKHELYQSYHNDLQLEGLLYLYDASGILEYLDHVLSVWNFRTEQNADKLNYRILFTCLHFETWLRTGNDYFIRDFLETAREFRQAVPRDRDGAVCQIVRPENKRIFVDMLQGYAVFMARAGWLSGEEVFFNECVRQYEIFRSILRNPVTGLWHQGRGWGDDPMGISPGHWNRGQGWVIRGMTDSLDYLPEDGMYFNRMLDMLREFASDLLQYQDLRGMWHQLTDRGEAYPETSGTAFFIHNLYKAFHRGWIPREPFLPALEKSLPALLGFIHKDGSVSNTSHGAGPLSSPEAYKYRPSIPGDPHGMGTMLMACAGPYLAVSPGKMLRRAKDKQTA